MNKTKNQTVRHEFTHDGRTYLIERDRVSRGYNEKKVVWNLDGTPRTKYGWGWSVEYNGCWVEQGCWASSLANAKAAIRGRETGDVCFE